MGKLPNFVQIKEVGPQTSVQNEKTPLSTEDKIKWINMLSETGVTEIEYSSFVNPKWIRSLLMRRKSGKG